MPVCQVTVSYIPDKPNRHLSQTGQPPFCLLSHCCPCCIWTGTPTPPGHAPALCPSQRVLRQHKSQPPVSSRLPITALAVCLMFKAITISGPSLFQGLASANHPHLHGQGLLLAFPGSSQPTSRPVPQHSRSSSHCGPPKGGKVCPPLCLLLNPHFGLARAEQLAGTIGLQAGRPAGVLRKCAAGFIALPGLFHCLSLLSHFPQCAFLGSGQKELFLLVPRSPWTISSTPRQ